MDVEDPVAEGAHGPRAEALHVPRREDQVDPVLAEGVGDGLVEGVGVGIGAAAQVAPLDPVVAGVVEDAGVAVVAEEDDQLGVERARPAGGVDVAEVGAVVGDDPGDPQRPVPHRPERTYGVAAAGESGREVGVGGRRRKPPAAPHDDRGRARRSGSTSQPPRSSRRRATAPSPGPLEGVGQTLVVVDRAGLKPAPGSNNETWRVDSDAACSRLAFWAVSCSICWRTLNSEFWTSITSPTTVARVSTPRRASSWAVRLLRRAVVVDQLAADVFAPQGRYSTSPRAARVAAGGVEAVGGDADGESAYLGFVHRRGGRAGDEPAVGRGDGRHPVEGAVEAVLAHVDPQLAGADDPGRAGDRGRPGIDGRHGRGADLLEGGLVGDAGRGHARSAVGRPSGELAGAVATASPPRPTERASSLSDDNPSTAATSVPAKTRARTAATRTRLRFSLRSEPLPCASSSSLIFTRMDEWAQTEVPTGGTPMKAIRGRR